MSILIVFDCDGTLVDSQATIVSSAQAAFAYLGQPVPEPAAIRRIVGLSLVEAMRELLPPSEKGNAERLAAAYKEAFIAQRSRADFQEALFEGALEILVELDRRGVPMGIATGKAMRGLRHVLEHHGLERYFVTLQTADLHPSKPHPAMLEAAMREAGYPPEQTLLVGDTTFDILMARAAGAVPIGVAWGNHEPEELTAAGAVRVLERFDQLLEHLPERAA